MQATTWTRPWPSVLERLEDPLSEIKPDRAAEERKQYVRRFLQQTDAEFLQTAPLMLKAAQDAVVDTQKTQEDLLALSRRSHRRNRPNH